jgi:hypothetical protein
MQVVWLNIYPLRQEFTYYLIWYFPRNKCEPEISVTWQKHMVLSKLLWEIAIDEIFDWGNKYSMHYY